MAMIAHGGRFASLLIEDEQEPGSKKTTAKEVDKIKKKKKKKKPQGPDGDLQTMIFGGAKSKPVHNPNLTSPSSPPPKPFPTQNEFVSNETDEKFESEMRDAILESKSQFESDQKSVEQEEVFSTLNPATQSLQENDPNSPTKDDLLLPKLNPKLDKLSIRHVSSGCEDVDDHAGEFTEIKRKSKKAKTPSQPHPFPHLSLVVDLPSQDTHRADLARNQELEKVLASKNEEIQNLQGQLNKLNQDNIALADLLSQCELKSKAELIREIEGINLDKFEMADELQRLSESFEQEKTRSKILRTELQRIQNKK